MNARQKEISNKFSRMLNPKTPEDYHITLKLADLAEIPEGRKFIRDHYKEITEHYYGTKELKL